MDYHKPYKRGLRGANGRAGMTEKNTKPIKAQIKDTMKFYGDPIRNEIYGMFINYGSISPFFYKVRIPKTKDKYVK